ncbi:hypothetical protein C1645_788397 [Glomus cerebriforme]|uniref:Uncharacterized protein n=1 Tax=Glomus cerebriforme TaxID=658196 RepID=A0A397SEH1_9GLOM|nr:hypothetical protein C1645_788397 [Glomus cerebriforme]
MEGFAIYIFVIGEIIDSYLNYNIASLERIRKVITANQTFVIFTFICESLVLLVKAY